MCLDFGVEGGDVGVDTVDPVQHLGQQEPVVVVEVPVERLLEPVDFGTHPRPRHLCQHFRVAFTGDQRGHHRPPRHPENVGRDDRKFDAGVFEELLDPVLFRGPRTDEIDAVAGQVP
jgi:hypothetical protein